MGTPELAGLVTFLVLVVLVVGPYYFFVLRSEEASRASIRQRIFTGDRGSRVRRVGIIKEVERLSSIGLLNTALTGTSGIGGHLTGLVERSGLKITVGRLITGSACIAMLAFLVVENRTDQALIGLSAAAVVGLIPYGVVRFFARSRLKKFEEQFPEAVDLMARSLRAGHAFTTGLKLAAEELPEPAAAEFRMLHDQQNYGLPMPDALKDFANRVPIIDARFFVTAVLTQREAGGNLAEVLDNLAAVIRERFKVKRQLRVKAAHGRITGVVLAGMPPCVAVALTFQDVHHFDSMLAAPLGIQMIIAAFVLQVLGAILIMKITDIEY